MMISTPTTCYSSACNRQMSFSTPGYNTPLSQHFHTNNIDQDCNYEDESDYTIDFAFDFLGHLNPTPSLSAEELFDDGKIKPFVPQPPLSLPKQIVDTRRDNTLVEGEECQHGRERVYEPSDSRRRQKIHSKSLSSITPPNMVSEHEKIAQTSTQTPVSSSWCAKYGKWKLTDLLLFRSASGGHATNERIDLFRKIDQNDQVLKCSNFRSSGSRKKRSVSTHEWHYQINQEMPDELRWKTFLPYKKNLIACMDVDGVFSDF